MFRFYDSTRRRWCRVGFLLLGVTPVLLVAAWCVWRHLPWQADWESRRLAQLLGMKVRLGAVQFLRPGATLYARLELADPETGQTVFRCRSLEVTQPPMADLCGRGPQSLFLAFAQAEIETAQLERLGRLVERLLHGECGTAEGVNLQITAPALTLAAGADSQTLTNVTGTLEFLPEGATATARFCLAGAETPEPITLRLIRNRQTTPPASGFELSTGNGEMPCALPALVFKEFDGLGARSRFRGYLWANQHRDGRSPRVWRGELSGQLLGVDLDALLSGRFPHKLSGQANLNIERARFRGGRLETAKGSVTAGPGVISRSLVAAAAEHLELSPCADLQRLPDQVEYASLAVTVLLDDAGLSLHSGFQKPNQGAILVDRRLCLLREPATQPRPAMALVPLLAPDGALHVPAAGPAASLARRLPLPSAQAKRTAEQRQPRAQLRLHNSRR